VKSQCTVTGTTRCISDQTETKVQQHYPTSIHTKAGWSVCLPQCSGYFALSCDHILKVKRNRNTYS